MGDTDTGRSKSESSKLAELASDVKSLAGSVDGVVRAVETLSRELALVGQRQAATEAKANSIPFGTLAGGGALLLTIMALYVNPLQDRLTDLEAARKITVEEVLPGVSRRISAGETLIARHDARIAENETELGLQWEETFENLEHRGYMRRFVEDTERRLLSIEGNLVGRPEIWRTDSGAPLTETKP